MRKELAKLIGISKMMIDRIENNKLNISQEIIKKVEKLLKAEIERKGIM